MVLWSRFILVGQPRLSSPVHAPDFVSAPWVPSPFLLVLLGLCVRPLLWVLPPSLSTLIL